MKAYDSVDWPFLFEILNAMDFPKQFTDWVEKCVSTARFSVVVNGELQGYFKGERAL